MKGKIQARKSMTVFWSLCSPMTDKLVFVLGGGIKVRKSMTDRFGSLYQFFSVLNRMPNDLE